VLAVSAAPPLRNCRLSNAMLASNPFCNMNMNDCLTWGKLY
jgi:hypothetical protein